MQASTATCFPDGMGRLPVLKEVTARLGWRTRLFHPLQRHLKVRRPDALHRLRELDELVIHQSSGIEVRARQTP